MMMWPFKKRPEEYEVLADSIPISTLIRWYLYDMSVEDPNQIVEEFKLMPVSPEGEDKEREDSSERVSNVIPLIAFFQTMAEINGRSIFQVQRKELMAEGMPIEMLEKDKAAMVEFYTNVGFAGIVAAFSSAAQLGLISINGMFTDLDALKGMK